MNLLTFKCKKPLLTATLQGVYFTKHILALSLILNSTAHGSSEVKQAAVYSVLPRVEQH